MARQGPRLHRLPQRLDYTLIPAPLDLSLPSITEKSPLPAIIVTPSSPIHTQDFAIAFLAPPTKPSLRERVSASINNISSPSWLGQSRSIRTTFIISLLFFIMITTHLITHQLAAYPYPRLDSEFGGRPIATYNSAVPGSPGTQTDNHGSAGEAGGGLWHWISVEFKNTWGIRGGVAIETGEFVVIESTAERPASDPGLE